MNALSTAMAGTRASWPRGSRNSPVAVTHAKRALRQGAGLPLAAGLEVDDAAWRAASFSADRKKGIAAFVQKRGLRWPGG
jgi:enoyl-CoA hydratase/carnithine racemase